MTRRILTTIALLGVTVTLAVGCGSSDEGDPIPASIRDQLDVRLDEAERRLDEGSPGACQDITRDTQPAVEQTLDQVPDGVDPDVRNALNEGFARLWELVDERCGELEGQQTETEPTTTEETTPPETTETETTPTETTDTETTPTEPTPTEPTTPDTGGDGNGDNGSGVGNGDGGQPVPGDGDGGSTPPGDEG